MNLPQELDKQKIATLIRLVREGKISADELSERLDKIISEIYNDGVEMGMVEALNYVEDRADRERLFEAIDNIREGLDNRE